MTIDRRQALKVSVGAAAAAVTGGVSADMVLDGAATGSCVGAAAKQYIQYDNCRSIQFMNRAVICFMDDDSVCIHVLRKGMQCYPTAEIETPHGVSLDPDDFEYRVKDGELWDLLE